MSDEKLKITRRGFVKSAGVLTGAAALLGDAMEGSGAAGQARKLGPGAVQIDLTVNGEWRSSREPRWPPRCATISVSPGPRSAVTAERAARAP